MFAMLLPHDPNGTRHIEEHPRPPRASWTDLFRACWSAVLSLRASRGPRTVRWVRSAQYVVLVNWN